MKYSEIESLVIRAKTKDKIAISELIKYFTPFIKSFSRKVFVNGVSAEDIEQDCYLELINIVNIYNPEKKSFLGFFHKSIRNNIFSKYKKQLNTKQIELREEVINILEDDSEMNYLNRATLMDLYSAIDKLSALEKDVLIKYYFEGIPLKDQAKLYNKSYITIVKRKETAIKKLKHSLLNKTY